MTGITTPNRWVDDTVGFDRGMLAKVQALNEIADDLAGEFQLRSALERILTRSLQLMDCHAGSISRVDEASGTYRKEADLGISCQSGQVFPINEGMTGEVVRHRGPVWFERYEDVVGGHISELDRRSLRGTIGVPLEWRGRIIGVCVVFSRDPGRRFGVEDAQLLSMFARHAAVALANATMYEAVEERARIEAAADERARVIDEVQDILAEGVAGILGCLEDVKAHVPAGDQTVRQGLRSVEQSATETVSSVRRALDTFHETPQEDRSIEDILRSELEWIERARPVTTRMVVSGVAVPLHPMLIRQIARMAQDAVANVVEHASAQSVRVGIVYESAAVSLLIQDDGRGFEQTMDETEEGLGHQRIHNAARELGGEVKIESVVGWGTSVRVRVPYRRDSREASTRLSVLIAAPRPLTAAGLSRLLTWSDPTIVVAGEAAADDEMLESVASLKPSVVVLARDSSAAALNSVAVLAATDPELRILVISPELDPDFVSEVLLAGATGCLLDTADGASLASAVISTSRGQVVAPATGERGRHTQVENLTSREREVKELLEQGMANKGIAEQLVISVKTVEKHVGAILRKSGLSSRTELLVRSRTSAW